MPFLSDSERAAWLASITPSPELLWFAGTLAHLQDEYDVRAEHAAVAVLQAVAAEEARDRTSAGVAA